jgi:hypothetical protein
LDKKLKENNFPFSQNLFWDADIKLIDLKLNSRYVIERVLTRGYLSDFYLLTKLYTIDEIKIALRKSKELDLKTINFCSTYFNIPQSEMNASSFYR